MSSVSEGTSWICDKSIFPRNAVVAKRDVASEVSKMTSKIGIEQIEAIIGYTFREKTFLFEAFTHASYLPNRLTRSYERLEVSKIFLC